MTKSAAAKYIENTEVAALVVGFATALRRAGISNSPDRMGWLAQALRIIPPSGRNQLYWTCRAVFVSSKEQLPIFDSVFASIFDELLDPADTRGDNNGPPSIGSEPQTRTTPPDQRPVSTSNHEEVESPPPASSPGGNSSNDQPAREREAILMLTSTEERLHDMSFNELSSDETLQIRNLVRKIALSTPIRHSRRTRQSSHSSDHLDMRRTIRAAQRTGTYTPRLIYTRKRTRQRQLVLLCDVSGSMEPYTRVFLSLLQGAVSGTRAEAFIFSTQLTRLTRQLALHNADQALARAADSTSDWAGGTRLAESIRRFVDDYGRRGMARGAIVVVFSDGWAQDDPKLVSAQMARLRRLAYRIIWVNPRKVAQNYQPLVGGMAAALPYCDAFLSGHSYTALIELAALISA